MAIEYYVIDPDGNEWDHKWNGSETKALAKANWEHANSFEVEYEDETDGVWKTYNGEYLWERDAVPDGWTIEKRTVPDTWNQCLRCGTSVRAPMMYCGICSFDKEPIGCRD